MDVKVIPLSRVFKVTVSQVDSRIHYQRRMTAANRKQEKWEFPSTFDFERRTLLTSLSEQSSALEESNKSSLVDAIMTGVKDVRHKEQGQLALECGSLQHWMPWKEQDALAETCNIHADYLLRYALELCGYRIIYSVHKRRCWQSRLPCWVLPPAKQQQDSGLCC